MRAEEDTASLESIEASSPQNVYILTTEKQYPLDIQKCHERKYHL